MKYMLFYLLMILVLTTQANGATQNFAIDLNQVELRTAISTLATFMHLDVIISPNVTGNTSLHIKKTDAATIFDFLLSTNGLGKWHSGKIWFIAPRAELIQQQAEEVKWRETLEQAQRRQTATWLVHYARAADVAQLLQNDHDSLLSKRGQLRVDNRTNIIYIEDTAERLQKIQALLARIDVPVQQIEIGVRLASVDVDFEQELGVSFTTVAGNSEGSENEQGKTSAKPGHFSLAIAKLADYTSLDVKLSALEIAGRAELISSPRLFTANLQTSAIEAGEEVPYQAVSLSGGTAVEFKKAVLGLKVTPQVLPDKRVMLAIQINQDRPGSKMVLGMPTISTRQITSNVIAKSGQTIVLGGIYELNKEFGEQGLPMISQVPVIGWLFKQRNKRITKRELLIFVTPKVL